MSRSRRRRDNQAAQAKQAKIPVVIAGDNLAGVTLPGHVYEAKPRVELDPKVDGEHRWIVMAAWRASADLVATAQDPDVLKLLDHENLIEFGIGCWDCEEPFSDETKTSRCPAGDAWTRR